MKTEEEIVCKIRELCDKGQEEGNVFTKLGMLAQIKALKWVIDLK